MRTTVIITKRGEGYISQVSGQYGGGHNGALEDDNPDLFLVAVKDVARARGMTQLAKDTGLGRESLYKALAPGAKPRYDTILKVVRALGVTLHASPTHASVV